MVAQTNAHHRQELGNANFVEKEQHDIKKLHQASSVVPEATYINESNRDKKGSKLVKAVTVESPNQRLGLQTRTM